MMLKCLKRHTFFLLSCCCVLMFAGLVGYSLSRTSETLISLNLPAVNSLIYLMLRCSLYIALFFLWKPLLRKAMGYNGYAVKAQAAIGDRYWVLASALLYESLIVQNLLAVMIRAFV